MTTPMITTYRGKNVDELTREEAIAALKDVAGSRITCSMTEQQPDMAVFFECSLGPKKNLK